MGYEVALLCKALGISYYNCSYPKGSRRRPSPYPVALNFSKFAVKILTINL